jgi:hypothetical protein
MAQTWKEIYWYEPDLSDMLRDIILMSGGSYDTQDIQAEDGIKYIEYLYFDKYDFNFSADLDDLSSVPEPVSVDSFVSELRVYRNPVAGIAVYAAYDERRDTLFWSRAL